MGTELDPQAERDAHGSPLFALGARSRAPTNPHTWDSRRHRSH